MNSIATKRGQPSIEWPLPIINDPRDALEQALCKIERLKSLLKSNNQDMLDVVISDEGTPRYATTIWEIYVIGEEKLAEVDTMVSQIVEANFRETGTTVGRHVDLQIRRAYDEALKGFRAANAVPIPDHASDEEFDAVAIPASTALLKFTATRVPDLRALHEKMLIIKQEGAITTHGVLDDLHADVEFLDRRHQRAERLINGREG